MCVINEYTVCIIYIYIFYQILSVNVISDTIMGKNGIRKKHNIP